MTEECFLEDVVLIVSKTYHNHPWLNSPQVETVVFCPSDELKLFIFCFIEGKKIPLLKIYNYTICN